MNEFDGLGARPSSAAVKALGLPPALARQRLGCLGPAGVVGGGLVPELIPGGVVNRLAGEPL